MIHLFIHKLIGIHWDNRYLGLFGDHIVPAILYRYTSELTRPDLVNANGKPLITKARLKAVWTRLANRLATVVADTSMVTISPQSELPEVQKAAVDLLEVLKRNLPDKCGEESGWNFEKAHSILHKVGQL